LSFAVITVFIPGMLSDVHRPVKRKKLMNEQTYNLTTQAPNKGGPFLPGLKARGILGRFGECLTCYDVPPLIFWHNLQP
jgi:hypothetical protein